MTTKLPLGLSLEHDQEEELRTKISFYMKDLLSDRKGVGRTLNAFRSGKK